MFIKFCFILSIFYIVKSVPLKNSPFRKFVIRHARPTPSSLPTGACDCMDYWDCITNDGHVYSYCGISATEVCCFQTRNSKAFNNNTSSDGTNNNAANNRKVHSSAEETIITTSSPPSSSSEELFTTGNEDSQTARNDFVSVPSTPLPFVTSSSSSSSLRSSVLPDVDYFYMLENGDGDLKQITTQEASSTSQDETTTIRDDNNDYKSDCGRQAINWKLDSKAEFREWPWHIALLEVNQDIYICGGTLISHDRVVTAAHCVKSYVRQNAPKLKVRAGEYDVSTNSEADPYIEVLVERIIMHPVFNNATLASDIAILVLRRPLNYTSNIRPICLPSHNNDAGGGGGSTALHGEIIKPRQCVVTGWGRVSENSPFSVVMKEIVVPLWNHTICQEKLQRNFGTSYKLPDTSICAGERGHDACDGDGGGGLSCLSEENGQWELLGIVSFGIGCGRMDNPGVYTSVLPYIQWIDAFTFT